MGKQYSAISDQHKAFIIAQKLFFVGTATTDSRVNVSPKGMDSLRVLDQNRVVWLNVTGSGNETAAHVNENPRMTIMFAAFEGKPIILRLYGSAKAVHKDEAEWADLYALFPENAGARQIFDLKVDLVQTSCGMAVPYFDYVEEREYLNVWANKKGEEGVKDYWLDNNQFSIDGIPTFIQDKISG